MHGPTYYCGGQNSGDNKWYRPYSHILTTINGTATFQPILNDTTTF